MARTKLTRKESPQRRYPLATKRKHLSSSQASEHLNANRDDRISEPGTSGVNISVQDIQNAQSLVPSKITSHSWVYILAQQTSSSTAETQPLDEGTTDNPLKLPKKAGKWSLFNNPEDICPIVGMSHHDSAWSVAKELVKKNCGIIGAKASTRAYDSRSVVCCYTSDCWNKREVKDVADAIRKAFLYPLDMYYQPENGKLYALYNHDGDMFVTMYKHTTNNEFYHRRKTAIGIKWQLVDFSEQKEINEMTLPSDVTSHQWLCYLVSPDNPEELTLHICHDLEEEYLTETAGKWLLFHDSSDVCPHAGVSHHDHAWRTLKPLVKDHKNNGITVIKCSTNQSSIYGKPGKGVVCCYTDDFRNKREVKKAADSIRKTYPYPQPMYYKTEEDSDGGVYRLHGDRQVTTYKHTPDNILFERDCENKGEWKQLNLR